jgi:hypothetical protein
MMKDAGPEPVADCARPLAAAEARRSRIESIVRPIFASLFSEHTPKNYHSIEGRDKLTRTAWVRRTSKRRGD